ncbi:MAG: DegV family protein [Clostridiales bacterium]|nr:DegV family protein [Clostridiales bacterium]
MKKFVIYTDSCCDLTKAEREQYDIKYMKMYLVTDGETSYADLDWSDEEVEAFYQKIREGARVKTAQITWNEYEEAFEKEILAGNDVLSISCSQALSASVLASYKARDELLKKYPDAKIICMDSLTSARTLGLVVITAAQMRAEGKSIDEVAAWVEEHRLEANQEATPEKLTYMKAAGRVSAASAFFGGLLNIKPIIISDAKGRNFAIEKVKGRRASLVRIAERVAERYEDVPYQNVCITHAVAPEDAEILRQEIVARIPALEGKISVSWIGPIIGATCGPGIVAAFFYGKKVTEGADEE